LFDLYCCRHWFELIRIARSQWSGFRYCYALPNLYTLPADRSSPNSSPAGKRTRIPARGRSCVFWKDITLAQAGEKHCVYGDVYKTYNTNEAWRIDFSSEKNSFFMYDTKYYYNVEIGDCVMAEGTIKSISGIPYLNIENQKLYFCE